MQLTKKYHHLLSRDQKAEKETEKLEWFERESGESGSDRLNQVLDTYKSTHPCSILADRNIGVA